MNDDVQSRAAEYRERAEQALLVATLAKSEHLRWTFLRLARDLDQLAEITEVLGSPAQECLKQN